MQIELLGLPDDRTAALADALAAALARLGLADEADVHRVEDVGAMIARGVRRPPALRVDGRVVCRGRVPTADDLVALLTAAGAGRDAAQA